MNRRRSLLFVIILGSLAMVWPASRYARDVESRRTNAAAAPEAGTRAGRATLRFFRNPATAPVLTAQDLDGREVSTASLRGKVVIVNFWATWCPPCRAEIPDLVALQAQYGDRLQIIGVSEDDAPPDVVKRFAAEHKINYPVVMTSPEIEKIFPGVSALPTSYILDRESRVVQKHVGMLVARTTEQELRALAGLPIDASIEEVDQTQGLKLDNGAQAMTIPGIDLAALPAARRVEALQKLNAEPCTCGCDLTLARCRVDDPTCSVSLPHAKHIVQQIVDQR